MEVRLILHRYYFVLIFRLDNSIKLKKDQYCVNPNDYRRLDARSRPAKDLLNELVRDDSTRPSSQPLISVSLADRESTRLA